jgi:hypothetical protein
MQTSKRLASATIRDATCLGGKDRKRLQQTVVSVSWMNDFLRGEGKKKERGDVYCMAKAGRDGECASVMQCVLCVCVCLVRVVGEYFLILAIFLLKKERKEKIRHMIGGI